MVCETLLPCSSLTIPLDHRTPLENVEFHEQQHLYGRMQELRVWNPLFGPMAISRDRLLGIQNAMEQSWLLLLNVSELVRLRQLCTVSCFRPFYWPGDRTHRGITRRCCFYTGNAGNAGTGKWLGVLNQIHILFSWEFTRAARDTYGDQYRATGVG